MEISEIQEKAHYIAVTGIIRKRGPDNVMQYLICKRSPQEKIFPGKWCVPGGRLMQGDFVGTPKDTSDHWFSILEKTLQKEIFEETNLRIVPIGYVSSLALIRPNGFSTIIISLFANWASGDVVLKQQDELVEHAWVTLTEASGYDLIENILEQIEHVDAMSHVHL